MLKKVMQCLLAVALVAAVALPASAQSFAVRAEIPFDFVVGAKTMAAGEFQLRTSSNSRFLIISSSAPEIAFTLWSGSQTSEFDGESHLVFKRYGSQYFLAAVKASGTTVAIPASREEKELQRASHTKPTVVYLACR